MLSLFIQSSIPTIELPDIGITWFDKILHFFAFGLLALLLAYGLKNANNSYFQNHYISLSLIFVIIYGIFDEVYQFLIPGRTASFWDWVADVLGILFFLFIYKKTVDRIKLKNEKLHQNRAVI
jgi:VanZ family protein